jgi:hypothetical protein
MVDQKENFCAGCVAGVAALVGAGTAGVSSKRDRKYKKVVFWIAIGITIISILILIYILFLKKCNQCIA